MSALSPDDNQWDYCMMCGTHAVLIAFVDGKEVCPDCYMMSLENPYGVEGAGENPQ